MYIRQTKVPTQFFATRPNFLYVFIHIMRVIVDLLLDFEVDRIGILPLNKVYLGVLRVIWG